MDISYSSLNKLIEYRTFSKLNLGTCNRWMSLNFLEFMNVDRINNVHGLLEPWLVETHKEAVIVMGSFQTSHALKRKWE